MEMDPANLSFSGLEMELGLGLGLGIDVGDDKLEKKYMDLAHVDESRRVNPRPTTPESDSSSTSLSNTQESPESGVENDSASSAIEPAQAPQACEPGLQTQTKVTFPQTESELDNGSLGRTGSLGGRTPRISREDVRRRLKKRSVESPVLEERTFIEVDEKPADDDGRRISTLTDFDLSNISNTELGTIETVVEKRNVAMSVTTPPKAFSLPQPDMEDRLKFDIGQFGVSPAGKSMSIEFGEVDVDMRSALDRLMDDVAGSASGSKSATPARGGKGGNELRVETVTQGVKAGRFEADDSMPTDTEDEDYGSPEQVNGRGVGLNRPPLGRAHTEPDLFTSTKASRTASGSPIPPPPPPKDAIRTREQLILEKRREAREREESESLGYYTPPRPSDRAFARKQSRRRSRSTGDMEELGRKDAGSGMLDISGLDRQDDDDLCDSIQRELRKLGGGRSVSAYTSNYGALGCLLILWKMWKNRGTISRRRRRYMLRQMQTTFHICKVPEMLMPAKHGGL
jgi:hypothetical protein